MRVPLLDLSEQYRALSDEIRAAADEVLASQRFILGPSWANLRKQLRSIAACPTPSAFHPEQTRSWLF